MNRATSLYLDLVRFIAAFIVFQSHASWGGWTGGLLWQLRPLGMEAVVVFFVLSGFVISFVTSEREKGVRIYAASRLARLYSVCLPAIIITFSLDAIGRLINPSYYLAGYAAGLRPIFAGLTFTNEIWRNHIWIGINSPYWSMGYEVPYYIAFGLVMFLPRYYGLLGAVVLFAVVGPNVAVLFPVWLFGLAAYRACVKSRLKPSAGLVLWIASLIGIAAVLLPIRGHYALWQDFDFDPAHLHDYCHYYLLAMLFAVNIVGFRGASPYMENGFSKASRPIRWCAGTTFAFYLLHLPVIQFVAAVEPSAPESLVKRVSVFVGVPVIVLLLAHVIERSKGWWRAVFYRLLGVRPVTDIVMSTAPVPRHAAVALATRLNV